jgi:hypothetical protein
MQKGWKSQFFADASTNDYDYANVAITYIYSTYVRQLFSNELARIALRREKPDLIFSDGQKK